MSQKNIPPDIKSKSIKEAKLEIEEILNKLNNETADLESLKGEYDRLLILKKHIEELIKKKGKEITASVKKIYKNDRKKN
tara:strand:- start:155 stop:394 length:240 start_codon:yes stop_codon:yes gene_type:complete